MAWNSLVEILQERARATPDTLAYGFLGRHLEEQRLTYGELETRARAVAARVRRVAAEGDRVLVCHLPGLDYVGAFFGCLYAGVVAVPVYPPQYYKSFDRIRSIVADARPRAALTSAVILQKLDAELDARPLPAPVDWIVTDALGDAPGETGPVATPTRASLAFLQYTSGSTAAPKGVRLSHGNLLANLGAIQQSFHSHPGSVGCIWLPPYHDMGLIGGILQPLYAGFPVWLMSPLLFVLRPARWLEAISRYRATISGGPNFAYELCVARTKPEELAGLDFGSWEVAFCGAEMIRASTLEAFRHKLAPAGFRPQALHPCYGLAEASLMVTGSRHLAPVVTQSVDAESLAANVARPPGARPARTLVGCGAAIDGTSVRIVDPRTRVPCPDGAIGEIWVAGPCVAEGYFGAPDESDATFGGRLASEEGPFLRTGDLGYLDGGELFVTGRLKDVIIVKGRNCYPQDIEHGVSACHPWLRPDGGAAFSIDRDGEERLVIVQEVEPRFQDRDLAEAITMVAKAAFACSELKPHDVVLVPRGSVARTSSGKLQRQLMKQRYLARELDVLCHGSGLP